LLASRDISGGIAWAKGLVEEGDQVPALVEKGKKNYAGSEILGKSLAVIGLGIFWDRLGVEPAGVVILGKATLALVYLGGLFAFRLIKLSDLEGLWQRVRLGRTQPGSAGGMDDETPPPAA